MNLIVYDSTTNNTSTMYLFILPQVSIITTDSFIIL